MNRLLNLFFWPVVKTRLKAIAAVFLIFYFFYLFKNDTLLKFLIPSIPAIFFLYDIMAFKFSKNISWMANSYFNKNQLIKFFFINQVGRYFLILITNFLIVSFGIYLLYKLKVFDGLLNIDFQKLSHAKKLTPSTSSSFKIPDLFRFYLSYGFAMSIGIPALFYLSPTGAQHLTPQELIQISQNKKFVNKIIIPFYIVAFILVSSFGFINEKIYPISIGFNSFWPFLAYIAISGFFVLSFNSKFKLINNKKAILLASSLALVSSLPHCLNIAIGLGKFHNPNSTIATKIEEAQFLGILVPSPPKKFLKTALKQADLSNNQVEFIYQHASVTYNVSFPKFVDNIESLKTLFNLAKSHKESKQIKHIYQRMLNINKNSYLTKKFEKKFKKFIIKRNLASKKNRK